MIIVTLKLYHTEAQINTFNKLVKNFTQADIRVTLRNSSSIRKDMRNDKLI